MKDIPISPRLKKIKRKHRIRIIYLYILSFILFVSIIFGLSYFSFDKRVAIRDIEINGTNIINWDEVSSIVNNNLSGKYLFLFSKRNSLIYPHDKIVEELTSKFPRMESLNISLRNFNTLVLNIKERSGTYLYCGESVPVESLDVGENCYFINNDGLIFDKAPYFSGDVYFKYYVSIENKNDPKGQYVMNKDSFVNIVRFVDRVKAIGLEPTYVVISNDGLYSLYLKHKDGATNPKIIFKKENDFPLILDNLSIAMEKKEFENEINSKYDTLSYIDLRFKNKVLYKFEQ